jgi:D-alanine-D-alanine ligase
MPTSKLKILVLAGGPDREREVSLQSGKTVSASLLEAGHEVIVRDIAPDNLAALDEFAHWKGDAVFPALHGGWGEGGGIQAILDQRRIPYVGCRTDAAALCMDKHRTKVRLVENELPTLPFELVGPDENPKIQAPLVIKAPREGSSIDLVICKTADKAQASLKDLRTRHSHLMIEQFCKGMEVTVGVLADEPGASKSLVYHALPPIRIVPATEHYSYEAKYLRDDTQYLLDPRRMGLTPAELEGLGVLAVEAFNALGCRHMSRVDFIIDDQRRPWILEVNTIPGFTSHSLLPMAAKHAGIPLPTLVDRLVRLALLD